MNNKFETTKSFFKNIDFIDTLKSATIPVVASILVGAITLTAVNADNFMLNAQMTYSSLTGNTVGMDIHNKVNKFQTENFNGVIVDSYDSLSWSKRGMKTVNTRNFYAVTSNQENNEISIEEIGTWVDTFNQHIKINSNTMEETHFLENIPLLGRLFQSEMNLKTDEPLKQIVNVDVKKDIPQITYYNQEGILTLASIDRYNILNEGKMKFITLEQAKKLNINAKDMTTNGIAYNGRLLDKVIAGDNSQYFLYPKDFKSLIGINSDKNSDKVFSYITNKGEMKFTLIGDLNFNTSYIIVDKNGQNLFENSGEKHETSSMNFNLINKLSGNEKTNTLKLDINKNNIQKIISVDKNGDSLEIVYQDTKGDYYLKTLGMFIGTIEKNVHLEM